MNEMQKKVEKAEEKLKNVCYEKLCKSEAREMKFKNGWMAFLLN